MLRLPNRQSTKNEKKWHSAWKALYQPIEEATGFSCIAIDPTIKFHKDSNSTSFSLPVEFAEKLVEIINKSNEEQS